MNDNKFTPAASVRSNTDHVFICRLALERCQQHLAHLHALFHLCLPEPAQQDAMVAMGSMRQLMASIGQELSHSVDTLSLCEE